MLKLYKNLSGNSSVIQYDYGPCHIEVVFRPSRFYDRCDHYFYSINKIGSNLLAEMKKCADFGKGLGAMCSSRNFPCWNSYEDRRGLYCGSELLHWELFDFNTLFRANLENRVCLILDQYNHCCCLAKNTNDIPNFIREQSEAYRYYVCNDTKHKEAIVNYLAFSLLNDTRNIRMPMLIVNYPFK